MKILKCTKCSKKQNQGKYCLDCGSPLETVVTSNVEFKPIKTKRTAEHLKKDIRNWLGRIGVQQPDIKINSYDGMTTVQYTLGKSLYSFSSCLQDSITNNIAAVEMFLHSRVLGIERGIETVEDAFAGYEALPDYTNENNNDSYTALGFKEKVSKEEARAKYKLLVKKYHPDVNPNKDTHAEFDRIKKAIEKIEKEE